MNQDIRFCTTAEELKELCRVCKAIDRYYGKPYDIEFAIDADLPMGVSIEVHRTLPPVLKELKLEVGCHGCYPWMNCSSSFRRSISRPRPRTSRSSRPSMRSPRRWRS